MNVGGLFACSTPFHAKMGGICDMRITYRSINHLISPVVKLKWRFASNNFKLSLNRDVSYVAYYMWKYPSNFIVIQSKFDHNCNRIHPLVITINSLLAIFSWTIQSWRSLVRIQNLIQLGSSHVASLAFKMLSISKFQKVKRLLWV